MFNFNTTKRRPEPNMNTAVTGGSSANKDNAENEAINSGIEKIEAQRRELEKKNPGFDMRAELENPEFAAYIFKNGITVEDAYFLVHRDEIIAAEIKKALERMAERRGRISENGAGKNSPASVKKNPKDMSDKEIDSIIERVQNGEKITF